MTEAAPLTRRTVVSTGLTFIGLSAVAACSSSTSGSAEDSASGTGDSSKSADGSIAELAAIPVGEAIAAKINGKDAVVARPTSDTVAAYTAICTHKGCTVDVNGAKLKCPCHGSEYNALTGAVTNGPATEDLASIKVTVANGKVVAG